MEDVDFSRVLPNYLGNQVYIEFGASEGNPVAPLFIAGDSKSLQGHHVVVSKHLDGFGLVPGCQGISGLSMAIYILILLAIFLTKFLSSKIFV